MCVGTLQLDADNNTPVDPQILDFHQHFEILIDLDITRDTTTSDQDHSTEIVGKLP